MSVPKTLVLLLAFSAVIAGCSQTEVVDVEAESAAIRELGRQWRDALTANDFDAILGFYAETAMEMPANTPIVVGHQAIRAWYESWLTTEVVNIWTTEVIEVAASGDLAYERGTYDFSMDAPDGPIKDVGKYVLIWKKIGGQWKAIIDISNSDLPFPGQ